MTTPPTDTEIERIATEFANAYIRLYDQQSNQKVLISMFSNAIGKFVDFLKDYKAVDLPEQKRIRELGRLGMKQLSKGSTTVTTFLNVANYAKQLENANARHVLNHIESICEKCGHTTTEDGCAFCITHHLQSEVERLKNVVAIRDGEITAMQKHIIAPLELENTQLSAAVKVKDEALENILLGLTCAFSETQHLPACDSFDNPYENWCGICKRRKRIKDALSTPTPTPSVISITKEEGK